MFAHTGEKNLHLISRIFVFLLAVMIANDMFRDEPNVMLMIALVTILILLSLLP